MAFASFVCRELQRESGIKTSPLLEITYAAESTAYAEVVSIQPLLEQRTLYNQQISEMAIVQAALTASQNACERLQQLREQQTYVSERELQEAQTRWGSDRARLISEEVELRDLRDQMLQSWGTELTNWALGQDSEIFERLLSRRHALLLITLRPDEELPEGAEFILVGRGQNRECYTRAYPLPRLSGAGAGPGSTSSGTMSASPDVPSTATGSVATAGS